MQKNYKLYILLEIFPHLWVLFWENLAPFIGFPYEILPRLWVTILGRPTHIPTQKIGKLPPPLGVYVKY